MVVDHVGFYLFPGVTALRVIGRISFPVFAFFIAEGCAHTRNKLRYLAMMFGCAVIAEIVFSIASNYVYGIDFSSIFTTFTIGIIAAYLYSLYRESVMDGDNLNSGLYLFALTVFMLAAAYIHFFVRSYEYGIGGVLIILLVYAFNNKFAKLAAAAVGIFAVALTSGWFAVQIYGLLAVPVLALYNGKRGKMRMKYFFYIFYPAHIVVILLVGLITGLL